MQSLARPYIVFQKEIEYNFFSVERSYLENFYGERRTTLHANRKYIKNDKRHTRWSNKQTRRVMIFLEGSSLETSRELYCELQTYLFFNFLSIDDNDVEKSANARTQESC